jgi:hypothetical protein
MLPSRAPDMELLGKIGKLSRSQDGDTETAECCGASIGISEAYNWQAIYCGRMVGRKRQEKGNRERRYTGVKKRGRHKQGFRFVDKAVQCTATAEEVIPGSGNHNPVE